jgi:predicted P-loop ATPase
MGNLEYAIQYANRGWPVFPLRPFRKDPLIKGGYKVATTNREQIEKWWTAEPDAGIGLATGHVSGVFVLDIDKKHDVNGWLTMKHDDNFDLDEIVMGVGQTTPSGGSQFFFKMPKEDLGISAGKLGVGIDTRGNGGYTVLPPTYVKKYERYEYQGLYEWLEDQGPDEEEMKEFPPILTNILAKKEKKDPISLPDVIDNTKRNDTLFRYCAKLNHSGMSEPEIREAIRVVNKTRCVPPLEDDELEALVQSACGYETKEKIIGWDRTSSGNLRPTYNNCMNFLEGDNLLSNLFRYNLFSNETMVVKKPFWGAHGDYPKKLDDNEMLSMKKYLRNKKFEPTVSTIHEAISSYAMDHKYHPVKDYLTSLKWDGTRRLATWLSDFMGAEDSEYTSFVGQMLLVAACARVDKPGCKYDYVVILEGGQGIGKSRAVQALAGEWFKEVSLTDRTTDTVQKMQGAWIIEVAEMTCFKKQEVESLKAFITTQVDNERFAYGRTDSSYPRQSIFIGTINPETIGYLTDSTGNRRFLPVEVNEIDVTGIQINRDQLFAEAWALYKSGKCPLYIKDKEIARQALHVQNSREVEDAWTPEIVKYLSKPHLTKVSALDIFEYALKGSRANCSVAITRRISNIMNSLGHKRGGKGKDLSNKRTNLYEINRPDDIVDVDVEPWGD